MSSPRIDELKAEGDTLYRQGDFQMAHFKYSEAIKLDSKNAILFSNRAASSLNLKEWVFLDQPSCKTRFFSLI
jgi:hypothetical protein